VRQLETRLTPSLTSLASFLSPYGASPTAALVMDGSGNLYGPASQGGAYGDGTVFEVAHGSDTLTALASFSGTNGANPQAALLMDSSGNLYGTAYAGGASGDGTIFELAKGSGTLTVLASFNGTNGANPASPLLMDSSGNLYGTTYAGGASGDGTVFELAKGSGTITALTSFNGTNGANPVGALVMDGSVNLYGTAYGGGASGDGTVFELAKGSGTITALASFNGTDGSNPHGGVVMDSGGNLFGATVYGGAYGGPSGDGTVFEVAKGSGTITTLASFDGYHGAGPLGALILDGSGNLYGTAGDGPSGTGTVFEVAARSGTITTLASFNGTDGAGPQGGLVMDGSGNLYGTASTGVPYGTVFEVAHGSGTITALASFITNGAAPRANLVMDGSGNLFGTTQAGGVYDAGTVFEVAKGSRQITTLASFNGSNGQAPTGLAMDSSGNLYGATDGGGPSGGGTVFELAAGSSTITTLASFAGNPGPSGLILDSSGNLYGTTAGGGAGGTVFELAKGSGTITTLASFNGTNGSDPINGVVMDGSGNLYGATWLGGPAWNPQAGNYGDGTVFELAKGSGAITTLASFDGTDGANPYARPILDGSGNLYGTTINSGGTVFEVAKGSGTITTLAWVGGGPYGGVVVDSQGNLYGITLGGGASGYGTAFELPAGSSAIVTLVSFDGADGANPDAPLMLDSSGNLYGATAFGGVSFDGTLYSGYGTVFELPGAALADQWTGANSAVDTNWSDGANWSLGTPPAAGQTVLFTNNSSVKGHTSTVDAGFTSAIGVLNIDSTWGGTITVNSPLSVTGNFTLASGSFGGSGAVTIAGRASQWTGGQIDLGAGGFTNTGTLSADTTGGNLIVTGVGTLTNDGTIDEAGTKSLVLENSATLSSAGGATFDLTNNGSVSQSGGGTFTNAGTLEKTGGTGTSTIATTTLGNTGTVAVTSGTLNISAAVTQVSGKTLKAGTWTVTGNSTVSSKLAITSAGSLSTLGSAAQATLAGPNSVFTNLSGLSTIDTGASFSLLGGRSFTTTSALTNNGSLTLSPGSILTVGGGCTQTSTGTLTIELGGTNKKPTFGQIVSTTGTVALAGSLDVASTAVPAVGGSLELLDNEGNSAVSGVFAGLAEGSTFTVTVGTTTMTFQVTYAGKDSDGRHNVVIKRIA
jgi:uncharacterized repeat protein (TIGR03803 family)